MTKAYLSSYSPLCRNRAGRSAIAQYGIPAFVDASCRREPDFESPCPSISALCHKQKFAPRLKPGDCVIYITHKEKYHPYRERHWRLVAILKVERRFETHEEADRWYSGQGYSLPSNCMVEGNPPVPLEKTDRYRKSLDEWDRNYRVRARYCGAFLVCRPIFIELHNPPRLTDEWMQQVFGRIPGTRNPPRLSPKEYQLLLRLAMRSRGPAVGGPGPPSRGGGRAG